MKRQIKNMIFNSTRSEFRLFHWCTQLHEAKCPVRDASVIVEYRFVIIETSIPYSIEILLLTCIGFGIDI